MNKDNLFWNSITTFEVIKNAVGAAWRDKSNCWFSILLNGSISNSLADLFRHPTSAPSYRFLHPYLLCHQFSVDENTSKCGAHWIEFISKKCKNFISSFIFDSYFSILDVFITNWKFLAHLTYNLKQCVKRWSLFKGHNTLYIFTQA